MKHLVEKQRAYFLSGSTLPIKQRKATLRKLMALLLDNEKKLADAIFKDIKKSYYITLENELSLPYGEINKALLKLKPWSKPKWYRTNIVNFPASSRSVPVPYGVSLIIGPWNYPYMLSLIPLISAIGAGNTVILKPSELTPHCSAAMAELINNNFPPELMHVVEGGIEETQDLLKQKFDKIFFTGSTKVGKIVMRAAADHLTPVTLELGGKNPVIVLPDCNIKMAAKRIMWGMLHNNGHSCVSPDHVYLHSEIKEQMIKEMEKALGKILKGDPRKSTILPRIVNTQNFDRLNGLIDKDKILLGGESSREELYIEPTVMINVEEDDPIMQEEVFGPVLPILEFNDINALMARIKNKPSPLVLYIFSGKKRKAMRIMKELQSGGGMINDTVLHFINMNTPFGGVGESGMGSYHGKAGFDDFSHYKTVLNKPYWFELFLKYPPYKKYRLIILRIFLGKSFRNLWK